MLRLFVEESGIEIVKNLKEGRFVTQKSKQSLKEFVAKSPKLQLLLKALMLEICAMVFKKAFELVFKTIYEYYD